MFKHTPQNTHNRGFPELGTIAKLDGYNFKVVAYPVCDNVLPYSRGIHTVYAERLHDRVIMQISAFYFEESKQ